MQIKIHYPVKIFLFISFITLFCADPAFTEPENRREKSKYPEVIIVKDCIRFVFIPGGTFQMGDIWGEGDIDERPVHEVTLQPFYISEAEVTYGQYKTFIKEYGYKALPGWGSIYCPEDDYPVIRVSWFDASTFCRWAGGRLPSEAEWEYVAKGGDEQNRYPWGNRPSANEGNFLGKSKKDIYIQTAPVKQFDPNPLGLYDLGGNVWEWCQDWYSALYYEMSAVMNPTGPQRGLYRVIRGASKDDSPETALTSNRSYAKPAIESYNIGFRVVIDIRDYYPK